MALIDKDDLFDQSFWLEIAKKLPELVSDLDGAEHLVDRYVGQYLPALLSTRGQPGKDHVWLAFWNYLVAPRSSSKPFGLTSRTADLLITEFQSALSRPG